MKPAPPVIKTRSATAAPFANPSLLNVVRPELFRHLAKSELLRPVEPNIRTVADSNSRRQR